MKRVVVMAVAAAAVFGGCAKALAAATATANASVTIDQPAGINVVSPLTLPTIATTPVVPTSSLTNGGVSATSTVAVSGATTGAAVSTVSGATTDISSNAASNATLTIYGQSGGDTVSMAVPETFQVVRTGGTEALTVKTNTNSQYDLAGNGVVLGGSILNADTMSVNVGGAVSFANNSDVVPGPYEGLLVVVVQYN